MLLYTRVAVAGQSPISRLSSQVERLAGAFDLGVNRSVALS